MKKKELSAIPQKTPTVKISGSELLVEAQVAVVQGSSILVLDIFESYTGTSLLCRHFLDKGNRRWLTLFCSDAVFVNKSYQAGEWSSMQYGTILDKGDTVYIYYGDDVVRIPEKTAAVIQAYCGGSTYRRRDMPVINLEAEIAQDNMEKALSRKADRITRLMEGVEPVTDTEGFRSWLQAVVFPGRYIIAETRKFKRGFRGKCCTCGKTFFSKARMTHNQTVECPKCGTEALAKTRVKEVTEQKNVLAAQQYDADTWVLRHFRFRRISGISSAGKAGAWVQHAERIRIFKSEKTTRIYYGEERGWYMADECSQTWWDKKHGMVFDHQFFLYPGSLDRLGLGKALKSTLQAAASHGCQMDYNQLVRIWSLSPYLEYLIKGGYYHLAGDIIRLYGCWSQPDKIFDLSATDTAGLIRLSPQRADRLRQMDGGWVVLILLQAEEQEGIKISQENLEFATGNKISPAEMQTSRTGLSTNKAIGYIRRQMYRNHMSLKEILRYYKDYLDMAAGRGADLTDDIIRINPRMVEYHDRYLEEKNRKETEQRRADVNGKYNNIRKDAGRNRFLFAWEHEGLFMAVPEEAGEIVLEGQRQHHCVGASDSYIRKMNDRETFILFLRRQEAPLEPYYTIEAKENGQIVQFSASYNRQPDKEKVSRWLKKWTKEVQKRQGGYHGSEHKKVSGI